MTESKRIKNSIAKCCLQYHSKLKAMTLNQKLETNIPKQNHKNVYSRKQWRRMSTII
jgi:hypothetical protein